MYKDNVRIAPQLDYVLEHGIPLMVIIGGKELQEGIVQLKTISTKEQIPVKREDLVATVLAKLATLNQ